MPLKYVNPAPRSRRKNGRPDLDRVARRALAAPGRRAAKVPKARVRHLNKFWKRAPLNKQGVRVLDSEYSSGGYHRYAKPNPRKRKSAASRLKKNWGRFGSPSTRARARSKKRFGAARKNAAESPTTKRKKKKMAKKLYGAAARAHAKKLRRGKKRRTKRTRSRKSHGRKSSKRSRAARKAARTRAANKAMRRAAARKGARRRKGGGRRKARRSEGHRKVRRRKKRVAAAGYTRKRKHARKTRRRGRARSHRRTRRRHHRGGRRSTQRSMLRARRTIRNRRKTALARATQRRYRMRSNPDFMGLAKAIVPVALSLYGSRAISAQLYSMALPGVSSIPAQYQGVVVSGIVMAGAHFLTAKVKPLQKYHGAAMIGTGINLVDQVLRAFAPPSVTAMFGLSGDIYDRALNDYVSVGEYMDMGATPIDDDITLRDYISVGALQEELGVEEELGIEEELGDAAGSSALMTATPGGGPLDRAYLGGVSQTSMMKAIPSQPLLQAIPDRSFTKRVRQAGPGYDNSNVLYGGIFGGGFTGGDGC